MTDSAPVPTALDWRARAYLLGPRESSWSLPVLDLVLGGACLLAAVQGLSFIQRFGPHPVYLADLVLAVVIALAQPWRKRALRLSAATTFLALGAYAVLTFLSPVSLGVSPLALCALTALHATIRWEPGRLWRHLALAVAFLGCLLNPVNMLLVGRNHSVQAVVQLQTQTSLVLGVTTVTLGCVLVVVLVALDAWRRRRSAQAQDRALAATRQQAAEAERAALAREIHDLLGHGLTAIKVQAATALALDDPALMRATLASVEQTSATSLGEVRELVHALRSPSASETGLSVPADLTTIEKVVATAQDAGLRLSATVPDQQALATANQQASALQRLAVLRVVQEAVTNALRHGSGQGELVVDVDQGVRITVTNDLPGAASSASPTAGNGLEGLAERMRLVGGRLTTQVRAKAGGGQQFCLKAYVPLSATPATKEATTHD